MSQEFVLATMTAFEENVDSRSREVTEHWHRLPSEIVESLSLDIVKSHLDVVPCSWLWVTMLAQGEVGPNDFQRSLPSFFCDFVMLYGVQPIHQEKSG